MTNVCATHMLDDSRQQPCPPCPSLRASALIVVARVLIVIGGQRRCVAHAARRVRIRLHQASVAAVRQAGRRVARVAVVAAAAAADAAGVQTGVAAASQAGVAAQIAAVVAARVACQMVSNIAVQFLCPVLQINYSSEAEPIECTILELFYAESMY